MRQLTLLTLSLPIALFAYQMLSTSTLSYTIRDGLILATIAALLFLYNAPSISTLSRPLLKDRWSQTGRALLLIGFVCGLFGGTLFLFDMSHPFLHLLRLSLWLLGVAMTLCGLLWPSSETAYPFPRYRWQRDASGRFMRVSFDEAIDELEEEQGQWHPWEWLALAMIVCIGAVPRLWHLADWPAGCFGEECITGLRLMQSGGFLSPGAIPSIFDLVAIELSSLAEPSGTGLRSTSALFGIATIPLFYMLTRQTVRTHSALFATTLLALSPWHILISRSTDPAITYPVVLILLSWALLHAYRHQGARGWAMAGIMLGVALFEMAPFRIWLGLSAIPILLIGLTTVKSGKGRWTPLLLIPTALAIFAPQLFGPLGRGELMLPSLEGFLTHSLTILLGNLFQPAGEAKLFTATTPFFDAITGALLLLSIGYLLRYLFRPIALLVVGGLALSTVAIVYPTHPAASSTQQLLLLFPFLYLCVTAVIDGYLKQFEKSWSLLIHPTYLTVIAILFVLLINGPLVRISIQELAQVQADGEDATTIAIGQHLQSILQNEDGNDKIIFVPTAVLKNPQTHLLIGPQLDSPSVQPLNIRQDFLRSSTTNQELHYFLPTNEQSKLELLKLLYPFGTIISDNERENPPLFTSYHVSGKELAKRRGLQGYYFDGNQFGETTEAALIQQDSTLLFPWAEHPPLLQPFSVQWQGTLLIATAGDYHLTVDTSPDALFSLHLDNVILLDSSLGVTEKRVLLAEGSYQVDMRFRSDERVASDLVVQWQSPGGQFEPIPPAFLYSDPMPNVGLLGTYFAGDSLQGPALTQRKDLLVGADANLSQPYSVRWQGKLAAARSGEYLLGLLSQGDTRLWIDGQPLIHRQAQIDGAMASPEQLGYAEAVAYLAQGWHEIEIHHRPGAQSPMLQLFWQPPGGNPSQIPLNAFVPLLTEVQPTDIAYPPAPLLANESLGSVTFALTQAMAFREPQTILPPQNLPPLRMQQQWLIGNCGTDEGQLNRPQGVVISPSLGKIYVADTLNRRIAVYSLDGKLETIFTSSLFQELSDVEVIGAGALLVLDAVAEQSLFYIHPITGVVMPFAHDTTFYRPRGIAADWIGNIYVADTGNARIVKLDPTGTVVAQFGGVDTLLGKGQPVDVVVDRDIPWAITAEDGRLWRLADDAGVTAVQPSHTIDGPKLASLPLANRDEADDKGGLFITDPARGLLLFTSEDGQPLAQSAYRDIFTTPTGIDVAMINEQLHLAVVDSDSCTLSLWQIVRGQEANN